MRPQPASQRTWTFVAIAATIGVLVACLMPGDDVPEPDIGIPHPDKIIHAAMFFVVCFAWMRAGWSWRRAALYGVVLAVVTEVLQHTLGDLGRAGDAYDLLADGVGIGLAGLIRSPKPHRDAE